MKLSDGGVREDPQVEHCIWTANRLSPSARASSTGLAWTRRNAKVKINVQRIRREVDGRIVEARPAPSILPTLLTTLAI